MYLQKEFLSFGTLKTQGPDQLMNVPAFTPGMTESQLRLLPEGLQREIARCRRSGTELSVVTIRCERAIRLRRTQLKWARTLESLIRGTDVVTVQDAQTLCVILQDIGASQVDTVVERLRRNVRGRPAMTIDVSSYNPASAEDEKIQFIERFKSKGIPHPALEYSGSLQEHAIYFKRFLPNPTKKLALHAMKTLRLIFL